jgi:ATP-dependent Clp protease adaptor protein ClpS
VYRRTGAEGRAKRRSGFADPTTIFIIPHVINGGLPMSDSNVAIKPKTKTKPKLDRPKLYKVILFNDDYTPREFVVMILKAVFRMSEETGYRVMMTAHKLGSSVVVVCARDIAETKVKEAMDYAKQAGFPLMFTAEPEE